MIQKNEQKAVLTALADVAIKAADKEKKTAEALLLKAAVSTSRNKRPPWPKQFVTCMPPSHQRSTSALGHHPQGADRVISIHQHLWSRVDQLTRQDAQVVSNLYASPPAVMFLT